jgi:glycerate kinase
VRILIAPDTFKGSLSAVAAADAMARGVLLHDAAAEIDIAPMSDGGRGFALRMLDAVGGEETSVTVEDPSGRMIDAGIVWLSDRRAVFDAASACGLRAAPTPDGAVRASTFGVGQLLSHVARSERPVTSVIAGVGDTATTDGGTGAARAAAWRFLDRSGTELPPGGGALRDLASIVPPPAPMDRALEVVAGCDVGASLLGAEGAARRFAPQKGAGPAEVEVLEAGLERLGEVIRSDLGLNVGNVAGSGAGGGLGAGLVAFFGASARSGFEILADASRLDERLARSDLVLTGEGALDASSFAGKVTGEVTRRAREVGVPCAVVAGRVVMTSESLAGLGISVATLEPDGSPRSTVVDATRRLLEGLAD